MSCNYRSVCRRDRGSKVTRRCRTERWQGECAVKWYRLRACRVIAREPSSWWDTVQVNVGWQDEPDLAKDQPVVSPRGVVGKTGNVSRYVTDVILMVNENCSISALVEPPQAPGTAFDPTGQGEISKSHLKWETNLLCPSGSSGIIVGDYLYRGTNPDAIRCWKVATGDPVRGEAVFRRKELQCLACHGTGGAGGQVGPDLTSIGASAPVDYLVESLLIPNKAVKEGYHAVRIVTANGTALAPTH